MSDTFTPYQSAKKRRFQSAINVIFTRKVQVECTEGGINAGVAIDVVCLGRRAGAVVTVLVPLDGDGLSVHAEREEHKGDESDGVHVAELKDEGWVQQHDGGQKCAYCYWLEKMKLVFTAEQESHYLRPFIGKF